MFASVFASVRALRFPEQCPVPRKGLLGRGLVAELPSEAVADRGGAFVQVGGAGRGLPVGGARNQLLRSLTSDVAGG